MKTFSNKQQSEVDTVLTENELSFFIENFNEAILIGKPDGTILNFNSTALELFGYNKQEFKKIRRQDIFDITDKDLISGLKTREEKGDITIELTGIKKNGERFICRVSSKIYKTTNGELRTSTFLMDISTKKKAEDDLSLIMNLSEESFTVTDQTLKITAFNAQYSDGYRFHFNIDVVKGTSILEYEHPDKKKEIQGIYHQVLKGKTIQTEMAILSKNNNKHTFLKIIKPILDEKGIVIGTFTSSIDISKQKQEQQAKIAIEHKFYSVVNSTSDLISLIDDVGNYLFINKALENSIGVTLNEIKGTPHHLVIHPDDKTDVQCVFENVLKNPGKSFRRVLRMAHKNGHYTWVEASIINLLDDVNVKAIVSSCRDITQQITLTKQLKISEEKLKENLNQLIKLTDNVDTVLYQFEMSPDGKMTFPYISNSVKKMIPDIDIEGLKTDSSLAFKSIHPEDIEGLVTSIYESRDSLTNWNYQYRQLADTGIIKWIKGSSKPAKKEDGTVVWYGYLLDITDRVISEQKLKEYNQRYDIIAKATNDTIWDRDLITDKIIWNKGIQGIYGYKADEPGMSEGCSWWDSKIHPDDRGRVKKIVETRNSNKTLRWEHEYRFLCADNTYKHVFDRGFLVLDANDVPIRMIGAMQDITVQKEEELRLKLLESVITNTTDSVIITKTNNHIDDQIITYANAAFIEMTGYSLEEIIGKNPRIFGGAKTDKEELAKIKKAIANSHECEIEVINYKKSGEEFWVNMSISPVFNEFKKATHFIAIEKDFTERKNKEIEKELLITELSQNNKDLRHFSYVISHNLRAPVANLLGLTTLTDQYKIPNKSLKFIIDSIKQSANRFDDTLKDLTHILMIKDQTNVVKEDVLLVNTITNILSQLSILINDNEVKLSYDFTNAPMVYFTTSYLESVFLNLITNSIKYKSLKLKPNITIYASETDEFVIVTYKDNGIGIDLETHKEKLFKLYQRFHDRSEGKGMGLYLIKSQIEAMDGEITIESEVNVGTTFTMKFKK